MTAPKRKGRAAQPGEDAATKMLTMRMRPKDYEEIRAAAELNGRSISAQAEMRLLQPETSELARVIDTAIRAVEQRSGKSWSKDELTRLQCREAVQTIANVLLGDAVDRDAILAQISDALAQAQQTEAGLLKPGSKGPKIVGKVVTDLARMDQVLEAHRVAIDVLKSLGVTT